MPVAAGAPAHPLPTASAAPRARRVGLLIGVAALLLMSPSLFAPLALDDHVIALLARDDPALAGLRSRPLELLTFTTGVAAENRALIDQGVLLPWWAHEEHLNALFRPLAVLTHRLDLALWPQSALAMHAHSLAWYALLLALLARLYRELGLDRRTATLALAVFALDDVHGATVSWLANRNAILATAAGAGTLLFHHLHRRDGAAMTRAAAVLCFALALCSAESGVTIAAYLFAYAVVLEPRRGVAPSRALLALWPYAAGALVWRAVTQLGGYGTFASEVYLDPAAQPLAFLAALWRNVPALLASQFGPGIPFADLLFWEPHSARPLILAGSWSVIALMVALCFRPVREQPESRFWALSLVLAALPLAASAAGDRLLLPVGIGGSALVAYALVALLDLARNERGRRRVLAGLGATALVVSNLVLAPLLLPLRSAVIGQLGRVVDAADGAIPSTPAIREATVVVIDPPVDVLVSYLQAARARAGTPHPAHLYWLCPASSPFSVTRTARRTLRVDKPAGFLYAPSERHYRARWLPLRRGERVELSGMQARVVETTSDGRPRVVDFEFREPLESKRLLFYRFQGGTLSPFQPPADRRPRHFAARTLFDALAIRSLDAAVQSTIATR